MYLLKNRFTISIIFLLVSAGIIIYQFLKSVSLNYTVWGNSEVDIPKTGAVGDFIAGIAGTMLSLAGLILVYLTYIDQRKSNDKDKKEARIFTLIQIHVDNANNASYTNPYNQDGN